MQKNLRQKQLIINADDFGFSPGITEGILRAHQEGIVTSTTIVANMPSAAAAIPSLKDTRLGAGIHLNLSQGPPLSKGGLPLAGPDGVMKRSAAGVISACMLRPRLLQAVAAECEAQIRWVLDQGIRPTHLDSHRHSHAYGPILSIVLTLAKKYRIPFIRWHREILPGGRWPWARPKQRAISLVLNCLAWRNSRDFPGANAFRATRGTWGIAHTGRIDENWLLTAIGAVGPGTTEFMVHPGLPGESDAQATRLLETRRVELAALCSPHVKEAIEQHQVRLVHYGNI